MYRRVCTMEWTGTGEEVRFLHMDLFIVSVFEPGEYVTYSRKERINT